MICRKNVFSDEKIYGVVVEKHILSSVVSGWSVSPIAGNSGSTHPPIKNRGQSNCALQIRPDFTVYFHDDLAICTYIWANNWMCKLCRATARWESPAQRNVYCKTNLQISSAALHNLSVTKLNHGKILFDNVISSLAGSFMRMCSKTLGFEKCCVFCCLHSHFHAIRG